MSRSIVTSSLAAALLFAASLPLVGQTIPPPGAESVNRLIAVLKSDAPQHEKAEACRQLGVVGTKEAVPVLAGLLADEQLSHMARYALEPIPDPSVDDALRAALGRLKGRPLVGVIGSLGVRRDARAVEPLAGLLADTDADVAQAAARAFGSIGTAEAAAALKRALPGATGANQLALCEGLFRAAQSLATKGRGAEALAIYDDLRGLAQAPHQVRAGALRGAILARGKEGLPILQQSLGSQDYVLFAAAVRTAQEIAGKEVTGVLTAELGDLPADRQIVVIQALGNRADAAALLVLFAAAKSGPKPVRLAAIRAVAAFPTAGGGGELIVLLYDPDQEIAQAAQESFASLSSGQVDIALLEMLGSGPPRLRQLALELIGRRRTKAAVPALLKAAGDPDAGIRQAAMKRLGELAGAAEMPALVEMLLRAKSPQDLAAAEEALAGVCSRTEQPDSCAEKLAALLAEGRTPPEKHGAVLRVLGTLGGGAALKAVRASLKSPEAEVRAAAIRALAAWKTADVVPDLLELARAAPDATDKRLALRGYLTWAARADLPADERLAMCREAAHVVQSAEEKRRLLAALGGIASAESLGLIVPHLDAADTRDEAAAAAVSVAERIIKRRAPAEDAAKLVGPLKKVIEAAGDTEVAHRAKAALDQVQRKTRRK